MVARKVVISAIHTGIEKAARTYAEWTGGRRLDDNGVENVVTTNIAQEIFRQIKKTGASHKVVLEERFADIVEASAPTGKRGRPSKASAAVKAKRSGRVDIAILNGSEVPVGVIEVKRTPNPQSAAKDIQKIAELVEACGPTYGGKLQYGIFGVYLPIDRNKASDPLHRRVENLKAEIEKIPQTKATIVIHSTQPIDLRKVPGGEHLEANSFIVEIRAKYGSRPRKKAGDETEAELA